MFVQLWDVDDDGRLGDHSTEHAALSTSAKLLSKSATALSPSSYIGPASLICQTAAL